jgi:hypothetical protein
MTHSNTHGSAFKYLFSMIRSPDMSRPGWTANYRARRGTPCSGAELDLI